MFIHLHFRFAVLKKQENVRFIKDGLYKLKLICEPLELNLQILLRLSIVTIQIVMPFTELCYEYHLFHFSWLFVERWFPTNSVVM